MSYENSGNSFPAGDPNRQTGREFVEHVGVQPREPEYGEGVTQRVYEIQYGEYAFGVNLGDIAQVPTDAVMLPSTPWLGIGGGAIENVLYDAIGAKVFDEYTDTVRSALEQSAHLPEGSEKRAVLAELADSLTTATGMSADGAIGVVQRLTGRSSMAQLGGRNSIELEYGAAVPCVSGNLQARGINGVAIVNVTPSAARGQASGMSSEHMAMFTRNAAEVADQMGARSITIPAVGTGFAAAFGFGMSMRDSLRGFVIGAKQFADSGMAGDLRRIDFNIYATPSGENAFQVFALASEVGVQDILAHAE